MRINRNIVECKYQSDLILDVVSERINRNIVECKSKNYGIKKIRKHRINRNIVECKCSSTSKIGGAFKELIETLWNVNQS